MVEDFFRWVVTHPRRILAIGLALLLLFGSFLPSLEKDTRADAFLADDNPALIYKDKVRETFGLSDPMVVAVVAEETIFTAEGLNAIQSISESVRLVENVDPDGITSLATENNIVGTDDGMEVQPFFEGQVDSQATANIVRDAVRAFPLYQGTLVANDETASLIVVELIDDGQAEASYQALEAKLKTLNLAEGLTLHVAGEGAISGYLGSYIDSDASRLNPIAALIITLIVFIAFQRVAPTLLANVIILASALITFGAMAATGVSFFVITNALPVILIGIAVADSIHIYSEYFERRAAYPKESVNDAIVASMVSMWRPITLTTLTTAAGFLGLYFAAYMPPFKYFGLFTALGVTSAWLYSLLFLPAAMAVTKTPIHPRLAEKLTASSEGNKRDLFARTMVQLGRLTMRFPKSIVLLSFMVITLGLFSAQNLVVNDDRIDSFNPSEALYQADKEINSRFDGTNYLDVVVETPYIEGIFEPSVLNKVEALQHYAETLPHVQGSVSIVDYLKQMNRALNEGQQALYSLPDNSDLIAQYFLLYSTSGEPTDFEEEVDYDYRLANVRLFMNEGAFVDNKHVVLAMQDYIDTVFNDEAATATLSGRVNLTYHWIKDLGRSHFLGMGIALFLVWLVSSLLFRSVVAGTFALIPVATSILLVYTAMVVLNIGLGIGTSMFSAVAIGLGVDFAIHTIDRIKALFAETGSIATALKQFYPKTGRALFFNLLAIGFGFGVLISSKVVPLNNFGNIVALSVVTSFLISMTLLPAMILLFKPRFITGKQPNHNDVPKRDHEKSASITVLTMGAALLTTVIFLSPQLIASELPEGRWVAEQINQVDEGNVRFSKVSMTLTDKHGKARVREAVIYRKYIGEEKRTVLFYLQPRNVKDTAFLTYDYPQSEVDDDQWLYLPALRKSRRISASDRGDYFLGTDLTYEDMKKEGKFDLQDYQFKTLGIKTINGHKRLLLESLPRTEAIARELGYGKVQAWVDPDNWIIMKAQYWDSGMNLLKSLVLDDVRQVDGIWTRHNLRIENHKSGHITEWHISDVDYHSAISDSLFNRNSLKRGAP